MMRCENAEPQAVLQPHPNWQKTDFAEYILLGVFSVLYVCVFALCTQVFYWGNEKMRLSYFYYLPLSRFWHFIDEMV